MAHGSAPGERRGGRQKGTPNRATVDVAARLAALGCDPIEGMARLAMDPTTPPELRGRMFAELAAYIAPKRRAIEHEAAPGTTARFVIYGEREAVDAVTWQDQHAPRPGREPRPDADGDRQGRLDATDERPLSVERFDILTAGQAQHRTNDDAQ